MMRAQEVDDGRPVAVAGAQRAGWLELA